MVNFINLCSEQGIKVFALTLDDPNYILTANHQSAIEKIERIAFYQSHVRYDGNNTSYYNKLCHFHGVVTNIEPWVCDSCCDICDSLNNANNNFLLGSYQELIHKLYSALEDFIDGNFFYPTICSTCAVQNLDGLFMGTVHWFWHYYSMLNPNLFPNGDFGLFVGIRNGNHYFDVILPETYCPKNGYSCNNVEPCIDNSCNQCSQGSYTNCESIGRCYQWFEKHFILGTDPNYPNTSLRPIDAAPMLYGHSAFMFSTFLALNTVRENSKEITRICYEKNNYRGSYIYNYKESRSILSGNVYAPVSICNPDDNKIENAFVGPAGIRIFPNPVNSLLNVTGLPDGCCCYIYSKDFAIRLTSTKSQINTDGLQSGYYYFVVLDAGFNPIFRTKLFVSE